MKKILQTKKHKTARKAGIPPAKKSAKHFFKSLQKVFPQALFLAVFFINLKTCFFTLKVLFIYIVILYIIYLYILYSVVKYWGAMC